jgi:hypothetical protein
MQVKKYKMEKPWITGPRELLVHGLQHLEIGTDFDNRIGMISIDNAVELMIKTYLGLPKRITKIEGITRKKFDEITSNFPNLLDGIEEFASDKLTGIELGDIEWFHRVRNQLYHDGNGITVEKQKVETYAEIAKILFENLFETKIEIKDEEFHKSLVGEFINKWAVLERKLLELAEKGNTDKRRIMPMMFYRELHSKGIIGEINARKFDKVRMFRNNLVHGMTTPEKKDLKKFLSVIDELIELLNNIE